MNKYRILNAIREAGVVAVLRGNSPEEVVRMADKAIEGGIKVIEVTMTVPFALKAISDLAKRYQDTNAARNDFAMIGAGTVLDAETARAAILEGAAFIVSPSLNESTVRLCNRYTIPIMPGAMTVKEVTEALELGVDVVKLFPGNLYSPSIIATLNGPLPQANIMPTGGVGLDKLKDWISAGAFAVGIGSDLTKDAVQSNDFGRITAKAKAYMDAYSQAKASSPN